MSCTTPVLLCTTKYYSSTTLFYKVLLQYYSVLQSTTPILPWTTKYYSVLPCTTKYYSSTTLYYKVLLLKYYKVLLQYYLVLQSTTPVLTCTTLYCSSTNLYYKVLLCATKYYSSTTKYYSSTNLYYKVLLCTTKYYSVLQSTTPVLPCTTKYYSSTTLYYKVLLQYYSVLLQYYLVQQRTTPIPPCTTPVLPCTNLCYKVLLQYYSVLQSTTPIPLRTRNTTQVPLCTTPVLPCTTKYYSSTTLYYKVLHDWSATVRGATKGSLQLQQILRLPRKMNLMIDPHRIWNVMYNAQSNRHHPPTSPNTAPATQNESHDWSTSHVKRHVQCAEQQLKPSSLTKYCACHAKWILWLIHITYETSFTMRGATVKTLQPHQILRLPRKKNLMIDPHHIWNVIYNARSDRHHPATSPNTAPATQNESHDWSTSHVKRHLQCAEQQLKPSSLTKYCACHAKWISWLIRIAYETSCTMRRATGITLQLHQILRLPRKMNLMIDPHHMWNVIYNARSNS